MIALVAGLSGQLGTGMLEAGLDGWTVRPVLRPIGPRSGGARAERLWSGRTDAAPALEGDVTRRRWGLVVDDGALDDVDVVVNVAAETNWSATRRRLHEVNTIGAAQGYRLAGELSQRLGRPVPYVYGSTVFVAGTAKGLVPEAPVAADPRRTRYEHSKWLAEQHLLAASRRPDAPPLVIARLSSLLGHSATGATRRRNSSYLLVDGWQQLPGRAVPVTAKSRIDALPRDVAGELLVRVLHAVRAGKVSRPVIVHVCAGEMAPLLRAVLGAAAGMAVEREIPRHYRMPARLLDWMGVYTSRILTLDQRQAALADGLRYLSNDRLFERDQLRALIGEPLPGVELEVLVRLLFGARRASTGAFHDPAIGRFVA